MTCSTCPNPVRPPWTKCWPCFSGKPVDVVAIVTPVTVQPAVAPWTRPPKPAGPGMTVCRHCQFSAGTRARGLCIRCYDQPGVKELFPPTSKHARRGIGNGYHVRRELPEPTTALPGTAAKVAVLAARAEAGKALWHPFDAGQF